MRRPKKVVLVVRVDRDAVEQLLTGDRAAVRYEKTARSYLSMVMLGAILLWIKFVNTPYSHPSGVLGPL